MRYTALLLIVLCCACHRQKDWTQQNPYGVRLVNRTGGALVKCKVSYGRFSTLETNLQAGAHIGQYPVIESTPSIATVQWTVPSADRHEVTVPIDIRLPAADVSDLEFTIRSDMTVELGTRMRKEGTTVTPAL